MTQYISFDVLHVFKLKSLYPNHQNFDIQHTSSITQHISFDVLDVFKQSDAAFEVPYVFIISANSFSIECFQSSCDSIQMFKYSSLMD